MKNKALKVGSMVVMLVAMSVLFLSGCKDKDKKPAEQTTNTPTEVVETTPTKTTLGDFKTEMTEQEEKMKTSFTDWTNKQLEFLEWTNNSTSKMSFSAEVPAYWAFKLGTDATNYMTNKGKDVDSNMKFDIDLSFEDSLKNKDNFLKEAAGASIKAWTDLWFKMKDWKTFLSLKDISFEAEGNEMVAMQSESAKAYVKAIKESLANKWIELSWYEGETYSKMNLFATTSADDYKLIFKVISDNLKFDFIEADGEATILDNQPAFKLKLDKEKLFNRLADTTVGIAEAFKDRTDKAASYFLVGIHEEDSKKTPEEMKAEMLKSLKENIDVSEFEGYLVLNEKWNIDFIIKSLTFKSLKSEGMVKMPFTVKDWEFTMQMQVKDDETTVNFDGERLLDKKIEKANNRNLEKKGKRLSDKQENKLYEKYRKNLISKANDPKYKKYFTVNKYNATFDIIVKDEEKTTFEITSSIKTSTEHYKEKPEKSNFKFKFEGVYDKEMSEDTISQNFETKLTILENSWEKDINGSVLTLNVESSMNKVAEADVKPVEKPSNSISLDEAQTMINWEMANLAMKDMEKESDGANDKAKDIEEEQIEEKDN